MTSGIKNKKGFSGIVDLVSDIENIQESSTEKTTQDLPDLSTNIEIEEEKPTPVKPVSLTKSTLSQQNKTWRQKQAKNLSDGTGNKGRFGLKEAAILTGCLLLAFWLFNGGVGSHKTTNNYSSSTKAEKTAPSRSVNMRPTAEYYVTVEKLNLRANPNSSAKAIASLGEYDTVNLYLDSISNGWAKVNIGSYTGWAAERFLKRGSGKAAYMSYCRANVSRPYSGQVLSQSATGSHTLTIKNGPGYDVIAKLKDQNGNTSISFYVRANDQYTVQNIPSGYYKFQYASGESFCRACGDIFLDNMQANEDSEFHQYKTSSDGYYEYSSRMEYTLYRVANGNLQPNKIPVNQF